MKEAIKTIKFALTATVLALWGSFVYSIIQSETQSTITAMVIMSNTLFLFFLFYFIINELKQVYDRIVEVEDRIDKLVITLIENDDVQD